MPVAIPGHGMLHTVRNASGSRHDRLFWLAKIVLDDVAPIDLNSHRRFSLLAMICQP
jgi:hypothetical protein